MQGRPLDRGVEGSYALAFLIQPGARRYVDRSACQLSNFKCANPDPETLSFSRLGLLGTLSVLEDDVGTRGVKPLHIPAICHRSGLGHRF